MSWRIEYTDEFAAWWDTLTKKERVAVKASVDRLIEKGPYLRYPTSSGVYGSRHSLRELRTQCHGDPFRVLYVFDPRRAAILLIGGNKTGNKRWYQEYVPWADEIYDEHSEKLGKGESGGLDEFTRLV